MMLNDEAFADFLTSEIEKHVRAGMESVIKQVENRLSSLVTPVELPDFQKMIDDAMSGIVIPEPEKGADGKDGKDGTSVTIDDVKPLVDEAVAGIVIPEPDISHLEKRVDAAIAGIVIPEVKDGISPSADDVAKSLEHRFAEWALGFERKADEKLEKAIDKLKQPENGKDGRDAIPIENFDVSLCPDLRTVKFSLSDGEKSIEKEIKIPAILDRGVYSSNKSYEQGDAVTYAGGIFIAQVDNPTGAPETSQDWRLAVKRGRDGRESVKIDRKIETVKVKNAGNTTTGK